MLLLAACQPDLSNTEPTPEETHPPVEVTYPPNPTATQSSTKRIIIEDVCNSGSEVKRFELDSALMNGTLVVSVYLPPCYDETREGGYPVLYLLHGQTFNDEMWLDLGAGEAADELILNGAAQPFLMVFPYEEFYYRKADQTNFPQALLEEVIPFIETSFNVCTDRTCRALGGISRGASWAVRIGFNAWDLFASIGAHSLPTFHDDLNDLPDWLEDIPDDKMPRIYMDTGRFDPEVKTAYSFEQVLNEKGVLHAWHLNDGRHNTEYWSELMREYIEWYADGWDILE
jgi:enterochelin esterase-like enzyme